MGTYYNDNGDLKLISGATLWADAPIGAINAYGGATAPNGWLLCQGQAISRSDYAELFAVIGTAYGSGDGSTTFNLPDPREAALVGAGTNVLNAGSIAAHNAVSLGAFQDDQMQKMEGNIGEVFNFTAPSGVFKLGSASPTGFVGDGQYNPYDVQMDNSEAARTGTTTHGKQLGVNYIIKAKQVALPADFMDALDDKQDATDNNLETTSKQIVGAINELKDDLTVKGQSVDLYTGPGGNFTTPIPDDSKYLIVRIHTPNGGSTAKIYPTELIRATTIHESAYWNTVNISGYEVLAVYDISETSITPIVFSHGANTGDIAVTVTSIN